MPDACSVAQVREEGGLDEARRRARQPLGGAERSAAQLEPAVAPRLRMDPRHAHVPHRPRHRDRAPAGLLFKILSKFRQNFANF